jgi:hypothetical protein
VGQDKGGRFLALANRVHGRRRAGHAYFRTCN